MRISPSKRLRMISKYSRFYLKTIGVKMIWNGLKLIWNGKQLRQNEYETDYFDQVMMRMKKLRNLRKYCRCVFNSDEYSDSFILKLIKCKTDML